MAAIRYNIIRLQVDRPGQIVRFQHKIPSNLKRCTGFKAVHVRGVQTDLYIPEIGWFSASFNSLKEEAIVTPVSVQAFYMDATEISNNEYRQFVHWVRDSIAREKLYRRSFDDDAEQWVNVPDNFFKEPYRTLLDMGSDVQGGNTPFQLLGDSTNNSEVDKTILGLMGNIDQTKMKKLKNNQLINGYKLDTKSLPAADKKIEVVIYLWFKFY